MENVKNDFKYDPFNNKHIGNLPPKLFKIRPSEGVHSEMHADLTSN